MARRLLWLIFGIGLLALMVGCHRPSINVINSFPKRPADYPIYLTEGDVKEAYDLVATVRTEPFEEWESEDQGYEELRRWARRLGGDAVISIKRAPVTIEKFGYFPTRTYRAGTDVVTAYYYTGTIVRFDRSQIGNEGEPKQPMTAGGIEG